MSKDYYKILGIEKGASQDEVKKAYRKKAHQHHPDKGGGDEARFKEINEAYQVLGNEQKRKQYDQFGSAFENMGGGEAGGGGFRGWQDFARQAQGGGFNINMNDFGDLSDVFNNIFTGFAGGQSRGRQRRNVRGEDIETRMVIGFKEAIFGAEKEIFLNKKVVCSRCSGNGVEPGSKISACDTCNGSGQVVRMQRTILGTIQTAATCPDCGGEGKKFEKKCSECKGVGAVRENKKIKFKIPAGINDGETIRLSGEGEAGARGGAAGDLYINFQVEKDSRFKREDNSILSALKISMVQAALGDKAEVETIDGKVNLTIPAGTQGGKVFILKGKGATSLRRVGRGDHFVEIKVQIPESLSKRQRELLEEFAETSNFGKKKKSFWG
ncbi:MAG: molecular chaperone DnaJ [bacterium]